MDMELQTIGVSQLVGLINQTFDYGFGKVLVEGELANFKISKGRWVYLDLKDENSTVRFFGSVASIKMPLEDGMLVRIFGYPHLHNNYGFSMQMEAIELVGEGSIKRSAQLLKERLEKEGLFDTSKKRILPYPPASIALITSAQSAAYHDFIKIIKARYAGIEINLFDVQVQGFSAVEQIVKAIKKANTTLYKHIECLVLIRGGGSPEDLAAFSDEQVVRSVAASKIPTLVAIGHEIDVSLAELAADKRASTPSNAAELLVPDKKQLLSDIKYQKDNLDYLVKYKLSESLATLEDAKLEIDTLADSHLLSIKDRLSIHERLLSAYDPEAIIKRGYAIVRKNGRIVSKKSDISIDELIDIQIKDGNIISKVKQVK